MLDGKGQSLRSQGEIHTRKSIHSCYEARQKHGWLKSRPELKTGNKQHSDQCDLE